MDEPSLNITRDVLLKLGFTPRTSSASFAQGSVGSLYEYTVSRYVSVVYCIETQKLYFRWLLEANHLTEVSGVETVAQLEHAFAENKIEKSFKL